MISRVILGYDGSNLAREAFAYAMMIASAARAPILGLRVIETDVAGGLPVMPPGAADPFLAIPEPLVPHAEEVEQLREDAERSLNELGDYAVKQGVPFETVVTEGGLLGSLRDLAEPHDLIAVGMHGRFNRAGVGSLTRSLVEDGPCPVMVISGELRAVNRIVAAYDGTTPSRHAVQWGREAAEQTDWPLTVLAVSNGSLPLDDALDRAQELAPEAQVVDFGHHELSEAEQIEEAAKLSGFAMLAMGAYADSLLHQLFFGGTTGRVLRHINAPVVLVR